MTGINDGIGFEQSISITASSSNTPLIPVVDVDYTTGNPTGVLSFTPAAGKTGEATITVTLTDNGLPVGTTQTQFTVTVGQVAIKTSSLTKQVTIYPNPVNDYLNIELNSNAYNTYSIITLTGQEVIGGTISSEKTVVNTSMVGKGTYLLVLKGEVKPYCRMFIKG